jgi:hypothetical protein
MGSGEPPERFEIKLWPIGDENRYIEIKNPKYLMEGNLCSVLTKVITYREETPKSLREVQMQSAKRLKTMLLPQPLSKDGHALATVLCEFGDLIPTDFIYEANPLAGVVFGLTTLVSIPIASIKIWNYRQDNLNKRIDKITERIEKFENTPTTTIEVEQDEELEDIFNAIEKNEPLKIPKPKYGETYHSIGKIVEIKASLTQRAKEVYGQKLAAYAGLIARA